MWPDARTDLAPELETEVQYHMFLQYVFFSQWMKLKEKANAYDIQIMGDVPFYVGVDSVDVWAAKDNFLLDTDGRPIFIAEFRRLFQCYRSEMGQSNLQLGIFKRKQLSVLGGPDRIQQQAI